MTPSSIRIRRALPTDSVRLSGLAMRSKAHWGYPAAQLEEWRPGLTVTPDMIATHLVHVAVADGEALGFSMLVPEAGAPRLQHLWVDPAVIGQGVGRALLRHAAAVASGLGADRLLVEADPHAEGFYLALGACRVGDRPAPIPGQPDRRLPELVLATPLPRPAGGEGIAGAGTPAT